MNQDCTIVAKVAKKLKLKYKKRLGAAYGIYEKYSFVVYRDVYAIPAKFYLCLCVSRDGRPMQPDCLQDMKLTTNVTGAANGYHINIMIDSSGSKQSTVNKIIETASVLVDYLRGNGYANCDEKGVYGFPSIYLMDEQFYFLLDESVDDDFKVLLDDFEKEHKQFKMQMSKKSRKAILLSFSCTLFCAVIVYFIIHMFDFTCLAGFVIGFVAINCYTAVDKNCSYVGVAVCSVLSLAILYLVFRTDVAFDLYQVCVEHREHITFQNCFFNPKSILEQYGGIQAIEEYNYNQQWYSTLFLYIFVVAISCHSDFEDKKLEDAERSKHDRYKLDS